MNYYPFHVGDYAADTAHLEPIEDLAYRRMLDLYYRTEKPLPSAVDEVARLIRLRDHAIYVQNVLGEFFVASDDGWRHGRCDAEIAKMQDKQAKAKASAKHSVSVRSANAKRALNGGAPNAEPTPNGGATGAELPTPTPTPTPKEKGAEDPAPEPTRAGIACRRMRTAGLQDTNPAHPTLLALLAAGITDDELAAAAEAAVAKGKPFAYALAVAEGRRRDAAGVEPLPEAPPTPEQAAASAAESAARATAAYLAEQQAQRDAAKSPEAVKARADALAKLGRGVVTVITPNARTA